MLHQANKKKNVTYNVIPTLLAIGQSAIVTPDVQRHVVRAIDNLSNQGRHWEKAEVCSMSKRGFELIFL